MMTINDNRNRKTEEFGSLAIGDVFYCCSCDDIFMAVRPCQQVEQEYKCNAIRLRDGETYCFYADEEVELVSATLTIENYIY